MAREAREREREAQVAAGGPSSSWKTSVLPACLPAEAVPSASVTVTPPGAACQRPCRPRKDARPPASSTSAKGWPSSAPVQVPSSALPARTVVARHSAEVMAYRIGGLLCRAALGRGL
ncbi:MAG: hypothetical protein AB1730_26410 [Myxococcota bacterium]